MALPHRRHLSLDIHTPLQNGLDVDGRDDDDDDKTPEYPLPPHHPLAILSEKRRAVWSQRSKESRPSVSHKRGTHQRLEAAGNTSKPDDFRVQKYHRTNNERLFGSKFKMNVHASEVLPVSFNSEHEAKETPLVDVSTSHVPFQMFNSESAVVAIGHCAKKHQRISLDKSIQFSHKETAEASQDVNSNSAGHFSSLDQKQEVPVFTDDNNNANETHNSTHIDKYVAPVSDTSKYALLSGNEQLQNRLHVQIKNENVNGDGDCDNEDENDNNSKSPPHLSPMDQHYSGNETLQNAAYHTLPPKLSPISCDSLSPGNTQHLSSGSQLQSLESQHTDKCLCETNASTSSKSPRPGNIEPPQTSTAVDSVKHTNKQDKHRHSYSSHYKQKRIRPSAIASRKNEKTDKKQRVEKKRKKTLSNNIEKHRRLVLSDEKTSHPNSLPKSSTQPASSTDLGQVLERCREEDKKGLPRVGHKKNNLIHSKETTRQKNNLAFPSPIGTKTSSSTSTSFSSQIDFKSSTLESGRDVVHDTSNCAEFNPSVREEKRSSILDQLLCQVAPTEHSPKASSTFANSHLQINDLESSVATTVESVSVCATPSCQPQDSNGVSQSTDNNLSQEHRDVENERSRDAFLNHVSLSVTTITLDTKVPSSAIDSCSRTPLSVSVSCRMAINVPYASTCNEKCQTLKTNQPTHYSEWPSIRSSKNGSLPSDSDTPPVICSSAFLQACQGNICAAGTPSISGTGLTVASTVTSVSLVSLSHAPIANSKTYREKIPQCHPNALSPGGKVKTTATGLPQLSLSTSLTVVGNQVSTRCYPYSFSKEIIRNSQAQYSGHDKGSLSPHASNAMVSKASGGLSHSATSKTISNISKSAQNSTTLDRLPMPMAALQYGVSLQYQQPSPPMAIAFHPSSSLSLSSPLHHNVPNRFPPTVNFSPPKPALSLSSSSSKSMKETAPSSASTAVKAKTFEDDLHPGERGVGDEGEELSAKGSDADKHAMHESETRRNPRESKHSETCPSTVETATGRILTPVLLPGESSPTLQSLKTPPREHIAGNSTKLKFSCLSPTHYSSCSKSPHTPSGVCEENSVSTSTPNTISSNTAPTSSVQNDPSPISFSSHKENIWDVYSSPKVTPNTVSLALNLCSVNAASSNIDDLSPSEDHELISFMSAYAHSSSAITSSRSHDKIDEHVRGKENASVTGANLSKNGCSKNGETTDRESDAGIANQNDAAVVKCESPVFISDRNVMMIDDNTGYENEFDASSNDSTSTLATTTFESSASLPLKDFFTVNPTEKSYSSLVMEAIKNKSRRVTDCSNNRKDSENEDVLEFLMNGNSRGSQTNHKIYKKDESNTIENGEHIDLTFETNKDIISISSDEESENASEDDHEIMIIECSETKTDHPDGNDSKANSDSALQHTFDNDQDAMVVEYCGTNREENDDINPRDGLDLAPAMREEDSTLEVESSSSSNLAQSEENLAQRLRSHALKMSDEKRAEFSAKVKSIIVKKSELLPDSLRPSVLFSEQSEDVPVTGTDSKLDHNVMMKPEAVACEDSFTERVVIVGANTTFIEPTSHKLSDIGLDSNKIDTTPEAGYKGNNSIQMNHVSQGEKHRIHAVQLNLITKGETYNLSTHLSQLPNKGTLGKWLPQTTAIHVPSSFQPVDLCTKPVEAEYKTVWQSSFEGNSTSPNVSTSTSTVFPHKWSLDETQNTRVKSVSHEKDESLFKRLELMKMAGAVDTTRAAKEAKHASSQDLENESFNHPPVTSNPPFKHSSDEHRCRDRNDSAPLNLSMPNPGSTTQDSSERGEDDYHNYVQKKLLASQAIFGNDRDKSHLTPDSKPLTSIQQTVSPLCVRVQQRPPEKTPKDHCSPCIVPQQIHLTNGYHDSGDIDSKTRQTRPVHHEVNTSYIQKLSPTLPEMRHHIGNPVIEQLLAPSDLVYTDPPRYSSFALPNQTLHRPTFHARNIPTSESSAEVVNGVAHVPKAQLPPVFIRPQTIPAFENGRPLEPNNNVRIPQHFIHQPILPFVKENRPETILPLQPPPFLPAPGPLMAATNTGKAIHNTNMEYKHFEKAHSPKLRHPMPVEIHGNHTSVENQTNHHWYKNFPMHIPMARHVLPLPHQVFQPRQPSNKKQPSNVKGSFPVNGPNSCTPDNLNHRPLQNQISTPSSMGLFYHVPVFMPTVPHPRGYPFPPFSSANNPMQHNEHFSPRPPPPHTSAVNAFHEQIRSNSSKIPRDLRCKTNQSLICKEPNMNTNLIGSSYSCTHQETESPLRNQTILRGDASVREIHNSEIPNHASSSEHNNQSNWKNLENENKELCKETKVAAEGRKRKLKMKEKDPDLKRQRKRRAVSKCNTTLAVVAHESPAPSRSYVELNSTNHMDSVGVDPVESRSDSGFSDSGANVDLALDLAVSAPCVTKDCHESTIHFVSLQSSFEDKSTVYHKRSSLENHLNCSEQNKHEGKKSLFSDELGSSNTDGNSYGVSSLILASQELDNSFPHVHSSAELNGHGDQCVNSVPTYSISLQDREKNCLKMKISRKNSNVMKNVCSSTSTPFSFRNGVTDDEQQVASVLASMQRLPDFGIK